MTRGREREIEEGGMLYGQVRQAALAKLSPISRWNPGRNSLTIQLQLGIPGPGP